MIISTGFQLSKGAFFMPGWPSAHVLGYSDALLVHGGRGGGGGGGVAQNAKQGGEGSRRPAASICSTNMAVKCIASTTTGCKLQILILQIVNFIFRLWRFYLG